MSAAITATPKLSQIESRRLADQIKAHLDGARDLILRLYEGRGWESLGYKSWRACVVAEFDQSKTHLYRQLEAARIQREISPMGEISEPIPERRLRPLAALPEGTRKEAYDEADAESGGNPTAAKVQEVVDRKLGRSRVNGKVVDDPPDVAAARKAGRIPEGVSVEIEEPEDAEHPIDGAIEEQQEREAIQDEMSDQDWLESLPLYPQLSGACLKTFQDDALAYRKLTEQRRAFSYHATRVFNAARRKGAYLWKLKFFLGVASPDRWLLCPTPENGGCNGTGRIRIGECPKCHGRGYWIN